MPDTPLINIIGGGFEKVKHAFSVGFNTGYEPIKEVDGPLELLNAEGCIAWDHDDPSKPAVHLHATFIDKEMERTFGGHLVEAEVVGLTAEVLVTVLSQEKITRKLVESVNVKLLDLPKYEKEIKNPQQNNQNNSGSAWQFILPVGLIILGLTAIISLLMWNFKTYHS